MIVRAAVCVLLATSGLLGCASGEPRAESGDGPSASASDAGGDAASSWGGGAGRVPESRPPPWVSPPERPSRATLLAGDGRPRAATLTIPRIGVAGLRVVSYVGSPGDGRGTRLQARGLGANPVGRGGGVGPGGIGDYVVTASGTPGAALARLPELARGDRVQVQIVVDGTVVRYTYAIVRTPARRALAAERAMVTLSAGDPRVDKVGVLVRRTAS